MRAKGNERRTEIREPCGRGMDKEREAEAIRQNPPRQDSDAYVCIFPRAQEVQPELRATNQQSQCTVARKNGQAQRSTGYARTDARGYRLVVKNRRSIFADIGFAAGASKLTGILSGEYAIVAVHRSNQEDRPRNSMGTTPKKCLNVPYSLDSFRQLAVSLKATRNPASPSRAFPASNPI